MAMNGEFSVLWNYDGYSNSNFWTKMVIGGLCGFAIGYFTSLQIKVNKEVVKGYEMNIVTTHGTLL